MKKILIVALLGIGALAHADANSKKLCLDHLNQEKGRLGELQRTLTWNRDALKNLEETIRARDASSEKFEKRSQELNAVVALLAGPDKETFEDLSRADMVYSTHDKEVADALRVAAEDVKKVDDRLGKGIRDHEAHIVKVDAACKALK
jgi:hypothetical protein